MLLKDKSIVVTGSGRGLGREFALAAVAHGARVIVNDIDAQEAAAVVDEITKLGGTAVASSHSVADAKQASELIDLCVSEFGRIDGLVNNAGLSLTGAPWEAAPADIDGLVDVNVKGVLYCGTAALAKMREQRSGVVVNLTSRVHIGWSDCSIYTATKGAVASATYGWALDMAEYGVRVVGLAPTADTRMSVPGVDASAPAQVAPVVAYLLSDRAHRLSGQILRFNGRKLTMLQLPRFFEPEVEREQFTVADIAAAVDELLADRICVVGLESVDLRGPA
jgi:NAD(P)-dependent dehydrogenase (short-subunit alcohol dehydrogenase family)